jgi:hypothetical protein
MIDSVSRQPSDTSASTDPKREDHVFQGSAGKDFRKSANLSVQVCQYSEIVRRRSFHVRTKPFSPASQLNAGESSNKSGAQGSVVPTGYRSNALFFKRSADISEPAFGEHAITVRKRQDLAQRRVRSGISSASSAFSPGVAHNGRQVLSHLPSAVGRAIIDNDYFTRGYFLRSD